ncbi:hypothetical protein Syun_005546 [Stephania yunnanensis]|uniref:Uncharacterized protein n=1 Tax=Stephania yunnanensis TaxID=152371 RepID=A0AAP0L8M7_9MAGN
MHTFFPCAVSSAYRPAPAIWKLLMMDSARLLLIVGLCLLYFGKVANPIQVSISHPTYRID